MQWLEEIKAWKKKESEKKQLSRRLEELKAKISDSWKRNGRLFLSSVKE